MYRKATPTWIMTGGLALTLGAGSINVVGFLGAYHQAVTHLTGSVSLLSIELAQADYALAARSVAVILFFFLGAFLSGFVIRQNTLGLGRRYGVVLALESALLFGAVYFLRNGERTGDYLASMACGLQNAMASSYSGAVVRTTHMTGIITDLGIACGSYLRRQPVDWARFRLYGVLLLGFFSGGLLGALGYARFGYDTLLFPAILSGAAGGTFTAIKHYQRHHPRAAS
ncbi:MAG: DUF1275 domain-containing protein [Opitutae bacterium]|nr:DUF1275 domain-containing protein [Opitutae bacterium]